MAKLAFPSAYAPDSAGRFKESPWGPVQEQTAIGKGIVFVSTAGHGGFFVPDDLVEKISPVGREDAVSWGGSEQWYEEDCCWAWVALAFPELFKPDQVEAARRTCKGRGFHVDDGPAPVKPTAQEMAAEMWKSFTRSERAGVQFGIFPAEKMEAAESQGYTTRALAVALMNCK